MYFFLLFDQTTYFTYIVDKSTPFPIIWELMVWSRSPILRGYALFLAITAHSILIIKICRKIHSCPNFTEPISLQNIKFCMCIHLLYFFLFTTSIPLSVGSSFILTIPLTYLWLSGVCTEKKQNVYIFSVYASWCADEVLIADNTIPQHSELNSFFFSFKYPSSYQINILYNKNKTLFLMIIIRQCIEVEWSAAYILERHSIKSTSDVN